MSTNRSNDQVAALVAYEWLSVTCPLLEGAAGTTGAVTEGLSLVPAIVDELVRLFSPSQSLFWLLL